MGENLDFLLVPGTNTTRENIFVLGRGASDYPTGKSFSLPADYRFVAIGVRFNPKELTHYVAETALRMTLHLLAGHGSETLNPIFLENGQSIPPVELYDKYGNVFLFPLDGVNTELVRAYCLGNK